MVLRKSRDNNDRKACNIKRRTVCSVGGAHADLSTLARGELDIEDNDWTMQLSLLRRKLPK
ncbi:hypothetical protein DPMN_036413 [Dreissena polymorpha]|uniref:Uncharacterized protein n=1 Tax=Dreissena polymorpha TaxID=45954 RepID=A0A9D4MBG9_DREPO|nr:hypothetical protein DPMN_036413 [Dreissena polymorpha]